jgi:hypothetical protein
MVQDHCAPALIEMVDSTHTIVLSSEAYLRADHTAVQRDLGWLSDHADRVTHGTISPFH